MSETRIDISTDNLLKKNGAEKPLLFRPEYIFAVDPSLRKPGFALLELSGSGRIKVVSTNICDNKRRKGTHGLLLTAIVAGIKAMLSKLPDGAKVTFVRERGFSRFAAETQALFKVIGVLDYILTKDIIGNPKHGWEVSPDFWEEIAPKSIKAIVAGSGNASKEDVRNALPDFVGGTYATLDESDAVAAGIAYCMMNNLGKRLRGETAGIYVPPQARTKAKVSAPKKKKEAEIKG